MQNRIADYMPTSWFKRPPGARGLGIGSDQLKSWVEPVEQLVAKHPGASLAVAFAAGVAIAWWLKRR